jgi:hypothetical protein
MAEKIVSPGVFTRESDQSQIIEGPIVVDAAVVGPTVKGPVEEPTIVTSFSDYKAKFGGALQTGSQRATHLTTLTAFNFFEQGGESLLITRAVSGTYLSSNTRESAGAGSNSVIKSGSTDNSGSFDLQTISKGIINNSVGPDSTNGVLHSGSADNIRWEISDKSNTDGTFNLLIRRGNDTKKEKVILEQFIGLSLDPFSPNYIEKVIGNQRTSVKTDENGDRYLQITGSYKNNSRYVYVSEVRKTTPNYLDAAGIVGGSPAGIYSASLPLIASGTFGNAEGDIGGANNFYGDINSTNTQGLGPNDYTASIHLLKNKDLYNYNVLTVPGLISNINATHNEVIDLAITNAEDSGDSLVVFDSVVYGTTAVGTVTTEAQSFNTSFAATYWPWLQTQDPETGQVVFVPASVMMPGVYAFNDKSKDPWFAPAGLNRGSLPNVISFLIALKRFIGGVATNLVFEQNTISTRNNFLAQVNPYLESVQQRQGLFAFKVVMDDTNNTPDIVDRNQLVGQVFIQPAKTAEFIILDFNILPTGVEFPS